jgi:hypothetical protein
LRVPEATSACDSRDAEPPRVRPELGGGVGVGKGDGDGEGLGRGEAAGDGFCRGVGLGDELGAVRGIGSPTFLPSRDSSGFRRDRVVDSIARGTLDGTFVRCLASSRFGRFSAGAPGSGGFGGTFLALGFPLC